MGRLHSTYELNEESGVRNEELGGGFWASAILCIYVPGGNKEFVSTVDRIP